MNLLKVLRGGQHTFISRILGLYAMQSSLPLVWSRTLTDGRSSSLSAYRTCFRRRFAEALFASVIVPDPRGIQERPRMTTTPSCSSTTFRPFSPSHCSSWSGGAYLPLGSRKSTSRLRAFTAAGAAEKYRSRFRCSALPSRISFHFSYGLWL